MENESRHRLAALLQGAPAAIAEALAAPWLNDLVPNVALMIGCGQGGVTKHLEGDCAEHTILVISNTVEVARRRLGREPDFIELLSALLHDLCKPATRVERADGEVSFPGHEALSAAEVPAIARRLELDKSETERLHFVVARHGDAHRWQELNAELRSELTASPYRESLAILQEADARSCLFPDGGHLPVFWEELNGRNNERS